MDSETPEEEMARRMAVVGVLNKAGMGWITFTALVLAFQWFRDPELPYYFSGREGPGQLDSALSIIFFFHAVFAWASFKAIAWWKLRKKLG